MPKLESERKMLSDEDARKLLEASSTKWLSLDQEWSQLSLNRNAIPVWIRPEVETIAEHKNLMERDPALKPTAPQIKFEAVWLKDIKPKISAKCETHWSDSKLRREMHVDNQDLDAVQFPSFVRKIVDSKHPQLFGSFAE